MFLLSLGLFQELVDDQTDNDLHDGTSNTAADELACKRSDVDPAGCRCAPHAEYGIQQGSAADTADRARDQIADIAEVGVLDDEIGRASCRRRVCNYG